MADYERPGSFLPTIKCSNCNNEIAISLMGEHICSDDAPFVEQNTYPNGSYGSSARTTQYENTNSLRPGKREPPRIDSSAANRPYLSLNDEFQDHFERGSIPDLERRLSPYPPRTTSRSALSPGVLTAENSLPSFPLESPKSPSKSFDSRTHDLRQDESSAMYGPPSPKYNAGGSLLRKMETITPGPFGVSGSSHGTKKSISEKPAWGHQRSLTNSSLSSNGSAAFRGYTPRQGSEVNPMLKRSKTEGPGMLDSSGSRNRSDVGALRPGERSQTLPNLSSRAEDPYARRPSESSFNNEPPGPNSRGKDRIMTTGYSVGNPYHTPTESQSSSGSANSDAKTGSSRSSPPLSDASGRIARKPLKTTNIDNLMEDIQESMETLQARDEGSRKQPPGPIDSQYNHLAPSSRPQSNMPESPMDPAVQGGFISREANRAPYAPQGPNRFPERAPTMMHKGTCRGCREAIVGKSVSSADGRLTGRYHRQCFVCKTCRYPFETAEFYVINNHPFCERHYHKLNNSLCQSCDRGIEGQYLETDKKQKFHPACLSCYSCHIRLQADYFELNGYIYCERDAFRIAQQATFGGASGRKNPERRTTRLMMMTMI